MNFEVTAAGFSAESSETDDRVIWVKADNEQTVIEAIRDTGATFCGETWDDENDIDYDLTKPGQAVLLSAELLKFASLERLLLVQRMCREALPKFNWGASFLDANAIDLLNRAPAELDKAIESLKNKPQYNCDTNRGGL